MASQSQEKEYTCICICLHVGDFFIIFPYKYLAITVEIVVGFETIMFWGIVFPSYFIFSISTGICPFT
jgi:hypothetical protein